MLKEEKRMLALQMKAKSSKMNMRSIGVGDASVDEAVMSSPTSIRSRSPSGSSFEITEFRSYQRSGSRSASPLPRDYTPQQKVPMRSIGVGENSVLRSDLDEALAEAHARVDEYQMKLRQSQLQLEQSRSQAQNAQSKLHRTQAELQRTQTDLQDALSRTQRMSQSEALSPVMSPKEPFGYRRDVRTSQNTHVHEKEVKTVIIGNESPSFDSTGKKIPPPVAQKPMIERRLSTRSIGVGDDTVTDTRSGIHVHEKETRTVILGGEEKVEVSKRNVGIECRVPTRDVGVNYFIDDLQRMTRSIAVGVGEGMFITGFQASEQGDEYDGEEGGESTTSSKTTSSHSTVHTRTTSYFTQGGFSFKGKDIKSALEEMLKKDIHSVGVQCSFNTEDKGTMSDNVSDTTTRGCGTDTINVEIRSPVKTASIAIQNKPVSVSRYTAPMKVFNVDAGTSTPQTRKVHRSTATTSVATFPASTNTDTGLTHHVAVDTDMKIFLAMDQIVNTGTNTEAPKIEHTSTSTVDSDDEVQAENCDKNKPKITLVDRGCVTESPKTRTRGSLTMKPVTSNKSTKTDSVLTSDKSINTKLPDQNSSQVLDNEYSLHKQTVLETQASVDRSHGLLSSSMEDDLKSSSHEKMTTSQMSSSIDTSMSSVDGSLPSSQSDEGLDNNSENFVTKTVETSDVDSSPENKRKNYLSDNVNANSNSSSSTSEVIVTQSRIPIVSKEINTQTQRSSRLPLRKSSYTITETSDNNANVPNVARNNDENLSRRNNEQHIIESSFIGGMNEGENRGKESQNIQRGEERIVTMTSHGGSGGGAYSQMEEMLTGMDSDTKSMMSGMMAGGQGGGLGTVSITRDGGDGNSQSHSTTTTTRIHRTGSGGGGGMSSNQMSGYMDMDGGSLVGGMLSGDGGRKITKTVTVNKGGGGGGGTTTTTTTKRVSGGRSGGSTSHGLRDISSMMNQDGGGGEIETVTEVRSSNLSSTSPSSDKISYNISSAGDENSSAAIGGTQFMSGSGRTRLSSSEGSANSQSASSGGHREVVTRKIRRSSSNDGDNNDGMSSSSTTVEYHTKSQIPKSSRSEKRVARRTVSQRSPEIRSVLGGMMSEGGMQTHEVKVISNAQNGADMKVIDSTSSSSGNQQTSVHSGGSQIESVSSESQSFITKSTSSPVNDSEENEETEYFFECTATGEPIRTLSKDEKLKESNNRKKKTGGVSSSGSSSISSTEYKTRQPEGVLKSIMKKAEGSNTAEARKFKKAIKFAEAVVGG